MSNKVLTIIHNIGFFAFYREAFEKIKYEEEKAFNNRQAGSEEEFSEG